MKRLGVLLSVLAVMLAQAAPADARATGHFATIAAAEKALEGHSIVNADVPARATLTGFTKITAHKWGTRYYPIVTVTRICPRGQTCAAAAGRSVVVLGGPNGWHVKGASSSSAYAPHSGHPWYQFWHWNWRKIWRWTWEHIFSKCIFGAIGGAGTLGSEQLAAKLIIRGGELMRRATPQTYIVAAVAGCFFNMSFGNIHS